LSSLTRTELFRTIGVRGSVKACDFLVARLGSAHLAHVAGDGMRRDVDRVRRALAAAEVLTLTALDVVTHAELRAAARADFELRTAGHEYVSPLRPEQLRPEGLPVWLTSDGSGEALADLARSKV